MSVNSTVPPPKGTKATRMRVVRSVEGQAVTAAGVAGELLLQPGGREVAPDLLAQILGLQLRWRPGGRNPHPDLGGEIAGVPHQQQGIGIEALPPAVRRHKHQFMPRMSARTSGVPGGSLVTSMKFRSKVHWRVGGL